MLSEEEKREIEAEFEHYPHKQAVSIEALKIVQEEIFCQVNKGLDRKAKWSITRMADIIGANQYPVIIFWQVHFP